MPDFGPPSPEPTPLPDFGPFQPPTFDPSQFQLSMDLSPAPVSDPAADSFGWW